MEQMRGELRLRSEEAFQLQQQLLAKTAAFEELEKQAAGSSASGLQQLEQLRGELEVRSQEAAGLQQQLLAKSSAFEELEKQTTSCKTQAAEGEAKLREVEAASERRLQELHASEAKLQAEVTRLREEQGDAANKAEGQTKQLNFALADREKQLQEKTEVVASKEAEIKDLLRQLAAVSAVESSPSGSTEEVPTATFFEVMFALEGSLGLEFQQLSAPYVVTQVHEGKVATGLGIASGDELVAVGGTAVTEASWEELVTCLSTRPVVARFCRDPARQQPTEQSRLFSSVTSVGKVGSSLLSAAKNAVPGKAAQAGAQGEAQGDASSRLQSEVERLGTLLKARDREVGELQGQLRQREEAIRLLEAADPGSSDTSKLLQEKLALSHEVEELRTRGEGLERAMEQLQTERESLTQQCGEERRLKEEQQREAIALAERCNSLMTQFESLRATCENLSLDAQQKASLETQVQQLTHMNAQWQQAHDTLHVESEGLRRQAAELQQLHAEVARLQRFEGVAVSLQERLNEAERQLETAGDQDSRLQQSRQSDLQTIQRLQEVIESMQASGESQAGELESELMERSRECSILRRELEEQRKKADELLKWQREMRESADESRSLKTEVERLQRDLTAAEEEKKSLAGVVDRCVEKLEKDSMERPHLVDKRMVTQMLAAYLEQKDNPLASYEIMNKMADLIGFTMQEREQCGLSQQRRKLAQQLEEPTDLVDLSDRFVDFLLEEAEA
eukprot:TRINITY_DN16768_c0_g1_i2.p1 TRINITY_DN16768_c0_g1~~TRINITY_DN16768_c0_g1_i2.p1  ORF type:complete len:738 (-),score=305.87 TRINITY_DN16768_c0_g1_i2:98-2311(-)